MATDNILLGMRQSTNHTFLLPLKYFCTDGIKLKGTIKTKESQGVTDLRDMRPLGCDSLKISDYVILIYPTAHAGPRS